MNEYLIVCIDPRIFVTDSSDGLSMPIQEFLYIRQNIFFAQAFFKFIHELLFSQVDPLNILMMQNGTFLE